MAGTTDMNIVLGQGNAIREVHNIRKQNLELNQQFVAQQAESDKGEDKSRVQEFEAGDRVEIKEERERKKREDRGGRDQDLKRKKDEEDSINPEGSRIDIVV